MADYIKIFEEADWSRVDEIIIDKFCWEYEYKPLSKAKVCLIRDTGICIRMWSYEGKPVSVHTKINENVYQDSCLEFFFNPFPDESNIYLNFEVNHLGAMLAQFGSGREDRKFLSTLGITYPEVTGFSGIDEALGRFWGIEYTIPFGILKVVYDRKDISSGQIIRSAFYKCGDNTGRPHYGSWKVIGTKNPDFHRPEYFGELIVKG